MGWVQRPKKPVPQPWGGQHWPAQVHAIPLPTVAGKSGCCHHTEIAQLHSAGWVGEHFFQDEKVILIKNFISVAYTSLDFLSLKMTNGRCP